MVSNILSKIINKSLNLSDTKLNIGLAKGLVAHFKLVPQNVNRIVLDNNGVSEEILATLIGGI